MNKVRTAWVDTIQSPLCMKFANISTSICGQNTEFNLPPEKHENQSFFFYFSLSLILSVEFTYFFFFLKFWVCIQQQKDEKP